jgi:serine/threonine protein kinase
MCGSHRRGCQVSWRLPMVTERSRRVLAPGKMFAGKFLLEENFAAGSMGSMWRARDTQRDVQVAIKVMLASLADAPGFVTRFEREASAAARIGSPYIVNIYEFGVHNHQPYIVMELLQGEDLHERFKHEERLPLRSAGRILRGICEGLHGAHEYGIVHRDLKPANVFLARAGDSETVKVLDFGIAKILQDESTGITATGQMIGTPIYMSPEQIQGAKSVDHRADLWAVSVIAFRALTGQLPFTGHTVNIIRAILYDPAPVPSSIAPELSPEVDAFFARALARNIDERFQTARELSDAISRLIRNELSRAGEVGSDTGRLSLGPAAVAEPAQRQQATKPPGSWKKGGAAKAERKAPAMPLDDSPESFRRVVPVDAPVLPLSLPIGDTPLPPRPGKASRSEPASEAPPPNLTSMPPSRVQKWIVFAAAAALLIATAVLLAVIASRS